MKIRKMILFYLGMVVFLGLPACTPAPPTPDPVSIPQVDDGLQHVIIDTDMSTDDVIAILYLFQRPDIKIDAITVTGTGVAYCEAGVRNARGLATLAGEGQLPVACGRQTPLAGDHAFPAEWRAGVDRFKGLGLTKTSSTSQESAVQLITRTVQAAARPITLLALGPLTNVAEVLQADPELTGQLERMVIMGGALSVSGNVMPQPSAEWNLYIDPAAANAVFLSGIPITLVPLDATNSVPYNAAFFEALKDTHKTPEAVAVFNLMVSNPEKFQGGWYFWDPLAAVLLVEPSVGTFEQHTVSVFEYGQPEAGRLVEVASGTPIQVAVSANSAQFDRELLSTLNGGIEVTLPDMEADLTVVFRGDECLLDGLWQAGNEKPGDVVAAFPPRLIHIDLIVEDLAVDGAAIAIVSLDPDKTFHDLNAWPNMEKPSWAQLLDIRESSNNQQSRISIKPKQGDFFIVCFHPDRKIGTLGPFTVVAP
jgi:pyrimidine-specific ribonucleoside hydrolase